MKTLSHRSATGFVRGDRSDLARSVAHPFYGRLNQILDQHDFDGFVEGLCQRFYAGEIGRPGLLGAGDPAFTTGC
jgi:hypothetical protein